MARWSTRNQLSYTAGTELDLQFSVERSDRKLLLFPVSQPSQGRRRVWSHPNLQHWNRSSAVSFPWLRLRHFDRRLVHRRYWGKIKHLYHLIHKHINLYEVFIIWFCHCRSWDKAWISSACWNYPMESSSMAKDLNKQAWISSQVYKLLACLINVC